MPATILAFGPRWVDGLPLVVLAPMGAVEPAGNGADRTDPYLYRSNMETPGYSLP
jgi:hypothetical protein